MRVERSLVRTPSAGPKRAPVRYASLPRHRIHHTYRFTTPHHAWENYPRSSCHSCKRQLSGSAISNDQPSRLLQLYRRTSSSPNPTGHSEPSMLSRPPFKTFEMRPRRLIIHGWDRSLTVHATNDQEKHCAVIRDEETLGLMTGQRDA